MNVLYSLIKMKARFFNIIIYLICCRCLVLHSLAAENSTVSTSAHFNKTEIGITESVSVNASISDTKTPKIDVNQTRAERNNTIYNPDKAITEIKTLPISEVSQNPTEPSRKNTTANITENVTKIPEKGGSTKAVAPQEREETKVPTTTAATPASAAEGNLSSNGRKGGFDGPSFIGGIILALGLIGFGYIANKFCSKPTNINYRNV